MDVHRYVCEQAHGEAPKGYEAAHTCGNKTCINPSHLYWATHSENMADAKRHGTLRGGGRHRQNIFAEDIAAIRASTDSLLKLAERFNSTVSCIGKIKRSDQYAV